jgi:Arc/MetJ family transcription regulator
MHMRTTLNLDDDLMQRAMQLTGLTEKTAVIRVALETLIRRESAQRLAALGGTDAKAQAPSRRRPPNFRRS